MSLVIAAAVASTAATLPVCSWDKPGHNPFRGDTVAAVDRYVDIPAPVRAALKKRMAARQFDEVAAIRRDSIEGRYQYTELRDMHFGHGQVCRTVTRSKWADTAVERGLVYCESDHCLIVPTVCRNVSRVTRTPLPPAVAAASQPAEAAPSAAVPQDELLFEAPGAGATPVEGPAATRSSNPMAPPGTGTPSFMALAGSSPGLGFELPAMVSSMPIGGGGFGGYPVVTPLATDPGGPPSLRRPFTDLPPPMPAPPAPVPEPSTYLLMTLGLGLMALRARNLRRTR